MTYYSFYVQQLFISNRLLDMALSDHFNCTQP